MQICYLYYSHVCFIPLSSFYHLTFLHFDILSIANSDEIGDLISISRSVVLHSFGERFALLNMSPESPTYIFSRGRGSGREKPNYGAFFLPMPTGSHICLSLPLRNFCKAVSVCPARRAAGRGDPRAATFGGRAPRSDELRPPLVLTRGTAGAAWRPTL